MAIPVVAVAVVLTTLCYRTGQHTANNLSRQAMLQVHARIENHLDALMDLPPAINQLNQSRLRTAGLALDDPARNRKPVFEELETFPAVSSIVLGSADGRVMWVIRYPGETNYEYGVKLMPDSPMQEFTMSKAGTIESNVLNSYAFDPTHRPWYAAAIEADRPTWGKVYPWMRGGKVVTLGIPYVEPYRDEQGKILGVINCELTLADISAYLQKLEVGKTGIAFIMERDGNLVATSTGMSCMKDGLHRLPATEAGDPRIVAAATRLAVTKESLHHVGDSDFDRITFAGEPAQMVASTYQNRRNLDWVVVTVVPDSDFLSEVQANRRRSTLIGISAAGGALLLGVLVAVWLLRPVLAVVAHARRVGAGDLDARIHRHDNREIGQLSDALNDMAAGLKDRMQLRHALNLAMEVQQSLLPGNAPTVRGLDVAARSKYCDQTGGDYYDYLDVENVGPTTLMIALGDVTGHGIAAAMLMATARGVLRSQVRAQGSLGHLLTHVNRHLVADTHGKRFMTMFLAVMDVASHSMRWASAGHDQPLIYDPAQGVRTDIDAARGGLPLGVTDAEEYEEYTFNDLRPGQVLLVGTDGLWEAKNASNEQFGKGRVGAALAELAHLPAAQIETEIYTRLQTFVGARPIEDDVTYVVIKYTADPTPSNGG